jgi:hypothetical protein
MSEFGQVALARKHGKQKQDVPFRKQKNPVSHNFAKGKYLVTDIKYGLQLLQ